MQGQPQNQPFSSGKPQNAPQGIVVGGQMQGGRSMKRMSFIDSVTTCIVDKFVAFDGRASRSEFWWFSLAIIIAGIPLGMIDGILFGWEYTDPTWLSWMLNLVIFFPSLAVSIRRIHDHGKSGWWCLCPLYNIYLVIVEGEEQPNKYGLPPTNIRQ